MSSQIDTGSTVPDFTFNSMTGPDQKFSQFKECNIVLYFYPRDLTPGCTIESKDFRDHIDEFNKLNTIIIGVSRDTVAKHQKFIDKHTLPFDLISDTEETVCQLFNTLRNKNMFGKQVRGIERSTFLIDKNGVVKETWRKVKVRGHVKEVLEAVKKLP
jgi:peroxiredoxin Q/BCP